MLSKIFYRIFQVILGFFFFMAAKTNAESLNNAEKDITAKAKAIRQKAKKKQGTKK